MAVASTVLGDNTAASIADSKAVIADSKAVVNALELDSCVYSDPSVDEFYVVEVYRNSAGSIITTYNDSAITA